MPMLRRKIVSRKNIDKYCDQCCRIIPGEDVIQKASEQIHQQVVSINTGSLIICPNCIAEFLQFQKMVQREVHLLSVYSRTMKLNQYKWDDTTKCIDAKAFINNILQLEKYSNEEIYKELVMPVHYKVIVVKIFFDNYKDVGNKVTGVSLPNDVCIASINPNVIEAPSSGMGLIMLPSCQDFIILERILFDNISILATSLNEMSHISKGVTSSRVGPAGGFMLPSGSSKSLSPITANERILMTRKTSVGLSLSYRNKDNMVKGRNCVYQDLHMKRLNAHQKFKEVMKSIGLQRIMLKEMISRLRSFLIIHETEIMSYQNTVLSFLKYDKDRISMETKFKSIGRSDLEAKLLSWCCSTGEMRNHQAVKAHCDGNKSHPIETMTLFGRMPVNVKSMKANVVQSLGEGYLILPLEGLTIKMKCGLDVIHSSLKSTLHLADNSRNTCNWSRVHGP